MGRFTGRLIWGLVGALALAGGAFADSVLDDLEGGTNANKFGAYWYFYTNTLAKSKDVKPTGCDKVDFTDALVEAKLEMITNAERKDAQLNFRGSYGAEASYEGYSGSAPHAGNYSAVMEFKNLLSPWKSSSTLKENDVYPGVGMGTMLTTDSIDGMGTDFKNATAIKFWMKASDASLVVKFKIEFVSQQADNKHHPAWSSSSKACPADASYEVEINTKTAGAEVGTAWTEYTIPLRKGDKLADGYLFRPTWEEGKPYDFDLQYAYKVAWFIEGSGSGSEDGVKGSISVDDISFVGYNFVDKWACPECVKPETATPPANDNLFSNFDVKFEGNNSLSQNKKGEYWYAYTDSVARAGAGTGSKITAGQWDDPYYTDGPSLEVDGNGRGYNGTNGAAIGFDMGTAFKKDGETVQPFVGIGTNLYDSAGGVWYNGSQLTTIWFRYRTTGFEELFVELHDEYATKNDDGEVYYTKLPSTDGTWKVAEIPISVLRLPSWAKARKAAGKEALDKTKLAKLQFKNQSVGEGSGTISLDEIFLVDPLNAGAVGVKLLGSAPRTVGLRAVYSRGTIGVNWNAATSVSSGKVQLVNTRGRVVASAPIAIAAGKITATLGAGKVPTGMYFVRVNAKDVNGKKIVQQTPISIVK